MYIGKLRQIASSNAALGLLLTLVLGLVILLAYVKFLEWNYKRIHKNGVKLTVKHPDVWLPDGPALAQHFVGTYATIHVSTPKPEPGERVRLMYLGEPQVDASVQPRLVLEEQVVQTTNFAGDLVFGPLPHVGNYEAQYVGSSKPLLGRVAGIYETLREWRLLSWLLNRQGELWVRVPLSPLRCGRRWCAPCFISNMMLIFAMKIPFFSFCEEEY